MDARAVIGVKRGGRAFLRRGETEAERRRSARIRSTSPNRGGWTDARFALGIYQSAAKRREKLRGRYLGAFDAGLSFGANWHQSKKGGGERLDLRTG
jgi:hypothetical protein